MTCISVYQTPIPPEMGTYFLDALRGISFSRLLSWESQDRDGDRVLFNIDAFSILPGVHTEIQIKGFNKQHHCISKLSQTYNSFYQLSCKQVYRFQGMKYNRACRVNLLITLLGEGGERVTIFSSLLFVRPTHQHFSQVTLKICT